MISSANLEVNERQETAATAVRFGQRLPTVLLVEDNQLQRQMIVHALRDLSVNLLQVASGGEAISAAMKDHSIDLMILDYELPDISGAEVIDTLLSHDIKLPFVVSTARGSERVAVEMMKRGASDYLIKDERFLGGLPAIVKRLLKQFKVDGILAEVERELRRSEQRMRQIIDTNGDPFVSLTLDGTILEWNKAAERTFGLERAQALGANILDTIVPPAMQDRIRTELSQFAAEPHTFAARLPDEVGAIDANGRVFPVEVSLNTVDSSGEWIINAFLHDISRRRELESQLIQAEKMASLGQLAAGVAHEINNPIAYVRSNLGTLKSYTQSLAKVIQSATELGTAIEAGDFSQLNAKWQEMKTVSEAEGLAAIIDDLPELFSDSEEGLVRVKEIVQNLKSFARLDEAEVKEADINECVETTLKVVANEIKYKCQVFKDLAPLPRLKCRPGQLNQVLMNLLINATQAVAERGEIHVRTWCDELNVFVSVRDTGCGIPAEHVSQLFTPFFTTKPVGSGTGLGLSISYGIVQKHGGDIQVTSQLGIGSTFTIRLPRQGVSK